MSDDENEWVNGMDDEICYISDAEENYGDDEDEGPPGE